MKVSASTSFACYAPWKVVVPLIITFKTWSRKLSFYQPRRFQTKTYTLTGLILELI